MWGRPPCCVLRKQGGRPPSAAGSLKGVRMTQNTYRTREVEPGIWQITDVLDNRAYLVVGSCAAVLVDTCVGYGNIRAVVSALTDLSVSVVLTHSHYDHVGGAYFYDEVFISQQDDDQWEYENGLASEVYPQLVERGTFAEGVPFGPRDGKLPRVTHVCEGDVFDLGGLTVEAVLLPAHTPGSMGYLVRERRVLLSGDAVTPIMCLFFPTSQGIEAYRATLAKMSGLPFDRFYTGHHDVGFARQTLASFDACAEYAQTARGITWQHALLSEFVGTAYLPPCNTHDVDSPDFRGLIGPYVPRKKR